VSDDTIRALVDRWRCQAVDAHTHGEAVIAVTLQLCADELERAIGLMDRSKPRSSSR
jgi:hypothetical protein